MKRGKEFTTIDANNSPSYPPSNLFLVGIPQVWRCGLAWSKPEGPELAVKSGQNSFLLTVSGAEIGVIIPLC
ncbi:hypothetical protein VULLAG_LOCUS2826 [Vulpes lagopus]